LILCVKGDFIIIKGKGGYAMFEEELLNNVMERYNNEFEEDIYKRISKIFMVEHLKLLKKHKEQLKSQIHTVSKMLEGVVCA
jgi:hypothetical protein